MADADFRALERAALDGDERARRRLERHWQRTLTWTTGWPEHKTRERSIKVDPPLEPFEVTRENLTKTYTMRRVIDYAHVAICMECGWHGYAWVEGVPPPPTGSRLVPAVCPRCKKGDDA